MPKIAGCACAGNAGNAFHATDFNVKPRISDPGMHHGTCVTHVPWCMSGSPIRGGGENVPSIPGACATSNFAYLVRGPWWRQGAFHITGFVVRGILLLQQRAYVELWFSLLLLLLVHDSGSGCGWMNSRAVGEWRRHDAHVTSISWVGSSAKLISNILSIVLLPIL